MSSTVQATPPSSNTGAQITAPAENRCIIDWFAFTIQKSDPYEVTDLMGLKRGLFTELERGGMGYKKRLQFGHITIFYDGSDNMGVHVEMSGQGCREFETSNHSWYDLIAFIELEKGKITRLDLAIDTVDGSLPVSKINAALRQGNVRTKFTKTRTAESADITPDGLRNKSKTRYFGSGNSRVMFRIYDKAAQLNLDAQWIRFELQLRDDRAQVAANQILSRNRFFRVDDVSAITSINPRELSTGLYKDDGKYSEGNGLLILDEAQLLFNSRNWQQNLPWIEFFTQHRKLGWNVILIAHHIEMIDAQIRPLCEYESRFRNLQKLNIPIIGLPFSPFPLFLVIRRYAGLGAGASAVASRDLYPLPLWAARLYDSLEVFAFRKNTESLGARLCGNPPSPPCGGGGSSTLPPSRLSQLSPNCLWSKANEYFSETIAPRKNAPSVWPLSFGLR